MRQRLAILRLALALLTAPTSVSADEVPRRIVSLNLCTDEIVLDLVERSRIAAVSHLASDPLVSPVVEKALGLPATRGDAESVLALAPDLVLAGTLTTPATLDLLERVGQRVVRVALASDLNGVRAAVRTVATAVGERAKGEALISGFDRALEVSSDASPQRRYSALIYQVNGLSAGSGSLADALIRAAGLTNHADRLGLGAGGALSLEVLAANPPDLLVLSGPTDEYRTIVAENLRHPVLAAVLAETAATVVPWRLWLCGTHHAAEAVRRFAEARRRLAGTDRPR